MDCVFFKRNFLKSTVFDPHKLNYVKMLFKALFLVASSLPSIVKAQLASGYQLGM